MTKTIENLLLNVMELATSALADGAPLELKRQAGVALRSLASMIDGAPATAAAPATSTSVPTSPGSSPTATPAPAPEPAKPDFMGALMAKLAPMLPEGAIAEAAAAARAEGFRMPMGIDLEKFVAAQAQARA
jgi:hypothetical protein